MAYNRDEKHAYEQLTADMKAGDIPAAVIFLGTEDYLIDFYAGRLIDRYIRQECRALDLVTLIRDELTADEIINSLETMPFLSERKVVYLPEFFDDKGKMPKDIEKKQNARKELAEMIDSLDPQTTLLLITAAHPADFKAERNIKESEIYKKVSKQGRNGVGRIYDFGPLNRRQLTGFIEKRFRTAGKQFRPGITSMIIRETDYESKDNDYGLYELGNDLQKIIAYCGSAPEITPDAVAAALGTSPEKNVFRMIDAMATGRKEEAFRLLHYLLQDGEQELGLLVRIAEQFEIMLTVCEMKDDGKSLPEIQKTLGGGYLGKGKRIAEYRTKKALENGSRLGSARLRKALSNCYKVEKNIKSGLMPGRLALEYFIGNI